MSEPTRLRFPSSGFSATASVPGDKSLGHRACILAAMAKGTSRVSGLSAGGDMRSTRRVLEALGVGFSGHRLESPGISAWNQPLGALDCGNSGTTMRLMAGALSGSRVDAVLTGDESLRGRPMRRLVPPLESLGADIDLSVAGTAPVTVKGSRLHGGRVTIPLPSAQVRTAVALAALSAAGATTITSPPGYRDHTERWLLHLGLATSYEDSVLVVEPGAVPPLEVEIPGDPSSAAYLWAAAAVRPGSSITTPGVSLNPGRLGFLDILESMGTRVSRTQTGHVLGDPIGDVTVSAGSLKGVAIGGQQVAAAIDELPVLAVVAAVADGETTVTGAAELATKESDRVAGSVALARLAGGRAEAREDGFIVGNGDLATDVSIDSMGDHRIAMAAAIAAIVRDDAVSISRFGACDVSWPGFAAALEALWS